MDTLFRLYLVLVALLERPPLRSRLCVRNVITPYRLFALFFCHSTLSCYVRLLPYRTLRCVVRVLPRLLLPARVSHNRDSIAGVSRGLNAVYSCLRLTRLLYTAVLLHRVRTRTRFTERQDFLCADAPFSRFHTGPFFHASPSVVGWTNAHLFADIPVCRSL